jgi:BirA family biotin operon repressor/biotin-[acetyl-CoA-carboxylase] ligase
MEMSAWPLITLMTSLAVSDALSDACGLQTDIKWPNDLLADGRKVCGILTETVETDRGRAAIVGIGVNLRTNSLPEELRVLATSIEEVTGTTPDSEELLRLVLLSFSRRYAALHQSSGPEEMLTEWASRSSSSEGAHVRVSQEDEIVEGVTRGLASDGALRVETIDGEIRLVRAGDVAAESGAPAEGRLDDDLKR